MESKYTVKMLNALINDIKEVGVTLRFFESSPKKYDIDKLIIKETGNTLITIARELTCQQAYYYLTGIYDSLTIDAYDNEF